MTYPLNNHELIEAVVEAGLWFRADGENFLPVLPDQILPLQADTPWARKIEAADNHDHHIDGEYRKWVFHHARPVEVHELAYPGQPVVVSVYISTIGGGGPEEGGWTWYRNDLKACFEIPPWPGGEAAALSVANREFRSWTRTMVIPERIIGYANTVGGQHYC